MFITILSSIVSVVGIYFAIFIGVVLMSSGGNINKVLSLTAIRLWGIVIAGMMTFLSIYNLHTLKCDKIMGVNTEEQIRKEIYTELIEKGIMEYDFNRKTGDITIVPVLK